MRPSVIGVILARMDSTRLPGKALLSVEGRPVLSYLVARARAVSGLSNLLLATTTRPVDDPLATFARTVGLDVFRGDPIDVAGRILAGARRSPADYVLRLNGDSPFPDPRLIGRGLELLKSQDPDLVTNLIRRDFPYGLSCELISLKALAWVHQQMSSTNRENVTQFFYENKSSFRILSLPASGLRRPFPKLAIDTQEDFDLFERVVKLLGGRVDTATVLEVCQAYDGVKIGPTEG